LALTELFSEVGIQVSPEEFPQIDNGNPCPFIAASSQPDSSDFAHAAVKPIHVLSDIAGTATQTVPDNGYASSSEGQVVPSSLLFIKQSHENPPESPPVLKPIAACKSTSSGSDNASLDPSNVFADVSTALEVLSDNGYDSSSESQFMSASTSSTEQSPQVPPESPSVLEPVATCKLPVRQQACARPSKACKPAGAGQKKKQRFKPLFAFGRL